MEIQEWVQQKSKPSLLSYSAEKSHDDNMITVSLMLQLWFNVAAAALENTIIIPKMLYKKNNFLCEMIFTESARRFLH